jgi:hypothetical protein
LGTASGRTPALADRIIAAVVEKMGANREELNKSKFGRAIWRVGRNGKVDIDLEPRI